jgi:hypothetical protein
MGMEYFYSTSIIWNVIDIFTMLFVTIFCILDFTQAEEETTRSIGSLAIFFLWIKFFYFLRIFTPTSAFIRMITEIIKDMGVFAGIYLLANAAFANAFFVLDAGTPGDDGGIEKIAGEAWWETLIYIYLTGLGEFGTDGFPDTDH